MKAIFQNKYGKLRSGWGAVVAIVVMLAGQMIGRGFAESFENPEIWYIKIIGTLIYSLITIIGGAILLKILYRQSFEATGVTANRWFGQAIYGLMLGIVAMLLVFTILLFSGEVYILQIAMNRLVSWTFLIELLSLGLTAFSEEFLLRSFLMTAFKSTRKKWVVLFAPSFVFALFHLLNPGVTILSFINVFLGGIVFSYMLLKSGSIWLPTGFHIAWNCLQGDILGMSVSGNEQASVITTKMGDNTLLTGGTFGPEGGILVTVVLLLVLVVVLFTVENRQKSGFLVEEAE